MQERRNSACNGEHRRTSEIGLTRRCNRLLLWNASQNTAFFTRILGGISVEAEQLRPTSSPCGSDDLVPGQWGQRKTIKIINRGLYELEKNDLHGVAAELGGMWRWTEPARFIKFNLQHIVFQ